MISIIIVDYNSMEETMSYINNFIEKVEDLEDTHFIIVDNSENDHNFYKLSEKYLLKESIYMEDVITNDLKEAIEEVLVYDCNKYKLIAIKTNANLGFAKANNIGALISKNLFEDSYIIFSNNDLVIKNTFSMKLLLQPFDLNSNIAVVGPKIIGLDNKPQSPRKKMSIWRLLVLRNLNTNTLNLFDKVVNDIDYTPTSKAVYWVTGCFMVVDSKKFFEVEMFDNNTFLYGEEMILSERLLIKKYHNYFLNDIEIIHHHEGPTKKAFNTITAYKISFDSVYYYYKNYIKSNKFELFVSKVTFYIYKTLFLIKCNIKNLHRV